MNKAIDYFPHLENQALTPLSQLHPYIMLCNAISLSFEYIGNLNKYLI